MTRKQEEYPGKMVEISSKILNEKVVTMPDSGPIRILFISDLHMFDPDADPEYINQVFKELDKPNTYAILLGDIIQGFNPSHASMAAGTPRLDDQMLTAEALLKKYGQKGKLIAAVGGTDSHEGWADKNMTFDAAFFMMRDIKGVDGTSLPIMNNGGFVTLKFPNGGEHRIRVYHNPGGGGSAKNMVGAQRMRALEIPIDDPSCPDDIAGGHNHNRAETTTEIFVDSITGAEVVQSFHAGGTAQGISPEHPNTFLTARGVAPSLRGLPAIIITPTNDGRLDKKDVWGMESSDKLLRSVRFWDAVESRGMGREVEGLIRASMPVTQSNFRDDLSRRVTRTDNEYINRSYDVAQWQIEASVPIITYIVGGTRFGSSSTDQEHATTVMKEVETNPEAFALITRRMVDKGLSTEFDRETHLEQMVDLIEPTGKKDKIFALLMDSGLREKGWEKELGHEESDGDYSPPVVTGDYIQGRIPELPLIYNNSFVVVTVRGIEYRYYVRDKLGSNGSTINPFAGLNAQIQKNRGRIDIATGGHMRGVGVAQSESRVVVAPGGFARWAEMGKANEERFPLGGQAVILYPDKKRMLACATFVGARDTHRAIFYYEGAQFLPVETRTKLLKMTRKK